MIPVTLPGGTISNPGNGFFRLTPPEPASAVTISQPDPSVALTGTLSFSSGAFSGQIDLGSERFLALMGKLPLLDVTLSGVDAGAQFSIILT